MQKPLILVFLFACMLVISCGKSTDSPDNVDLWVVSLYNNTTIGVDLGDDTALFTGYTFEFSPDNKLVIHLPDGTVKDAKWGADTTNELFVMNMDNPSTTLGYLVGDWKIEQYTGTDVKLNRDIDSTNPNPASATKLEFKKQ